MLYSGVMSTQITPVEQACKEVGSQAELAKLLKVSPPTVNQWVKGGRPVPVEACVVISKTPNVTVKRWDLRPDDWHRIWPELIDMEGAPKVPQAPAESTQDATENVASGA